MSEAYSESSKRLYGRVIESLSPNLLVQFNTSDPTTMTTEEMAVERVHEGGSVDLRSGETWYRLRERQAFEKGIESHAIFEERNGNFDHHYVDVITIEIIGVGSR